MEKIAFTHMGMHVVNEFGDYDLVWFNGTEVVHVLRFKKYELSDATLIGRPVCPACLIHRGIALAMTNRTIYNKPYCVTCGGELLHIGDACSCGEIPHQQDCRMWSDGYSGN